MDAGALPIKSLPFPTEVRLPLQAPEYEVELQVSDAMAGLGLEDTAEILSYYFGAVNGGAFCRTAASPKDSSLEIAQHDEKQHGSLYYRGRARNLAPGAWRILLSMLAQTHHRLDPLGAVRLVGTGGPGEQLAGVTDTIGCAYPGRVHKIPFTVEIDDTLPASSEFVVRVEFGVTVEDHMVELAEARFLDWDSVVYLGGYYGDYAEMVEELLDPTETYRLSPTTVEHRVRAWRGPPVALESLINIVGKLHYTCPVLRLEVE